MSSLITSLLAELGFYPREPAPHRPPQVESPLHGQTNPPLTSLDRRAGLLEERSNLGTAGGDAGSKPEPPFFTTLPKEMDRRSPDSVGNLRLPSTDPITSQTQTGHQAQPIHEIELSNGTDDHQSSPAENNVSATSFNGLDGTSLEMNHAPADARPSAGQGLAIDELGQLSLPADDGMSLLRNKIHAIQRQELRNSEKARKIHDLMTESYNSSRPLPPHSPTMSSPIIEASKITTSPAGRPSAKSTIMHSPTSTPEQDTHFLLPPEDLQPTYVPKLESESAAAEAAETAELADEDPDTEELDEAILGCEHYMRNVKLQCFTCKKWYTCRFCHDAHEDHNLVRRDTENMLCMLCGHAQPAAQNCRHCEEQSAQYYCDICKLWDNDSKKSIYHCNDCGICRIGQGLGRDFFHCKVCSPPPHPFHILSLTRGLDMLCLSAHINRGHS
ncbi:hypothetical protein N7470_007384 [Penicillium chermesinum]|nr:hypothetical protein N7470_007384 [Penicillium chermesinum]